MGVAHGVWMYLRVPFSCPNSRAMHSCEPIMVYTRSVNSKLLALPRPLLWGELAQRIDRVFAENLVGLGTL